MTLSDLQRVEAVARTYIDAYNEPDARTKIRMLGDSFDGSGVYISENQAVGFDGVLEMASSFHTEARMEIVGEVSIHHEFAMFSWQFTELAGGEVTTGVDFCEVGPGVLLTKVVVFFD
jgi:hypothetical protein